MDNGDFNVDEIKKMYFKNSMIHSDDQKDLDHFHKKSDAIKFFDRDDRDLILCKSLAIKRISKLK